MFTLSETKNDFCSETDKICKSSKCDWLLLVFSSVSLQKSFSVSLSVKTLLRFTILTDAILATLIPYWSQPKPSVLTDAELEPCEVAVQREWLEYMKFKSRQVVLVRQVVVGNRLDDRLTSEKTEIVYYDKEIL